MSTYRHESRNLSQPVEGLTNVGGEYNLEVAIAQGRDASGDVETGWSEPVMHLPMHPYTRADTVALLEAIARAWDEWERTFGPGVKP